jgi:hypothetical protein
MPVAKDPAAAMESASSVVEREMPGWKIVAPPPSPPFEEAAMKTDTKNDLGFSLAKLRQKFGLTDAATKDEPDFAPVDDTVETVHVQPKTGGPTKTADIKNGKITIVQG